MREFQLTVRNQPGSFSKVASALADAEIRVEIAAGIGKRGKGLIRLVADDPDRARDVLRGLGVAFDEKEVLVIDVGRGPHELADVLDRLAVAGVNVEAVYAAVGQNKLVLAVDKIDMARRALKPAA